MMLLPPKSSLISLTTPLLTTLALGSSTAHAFRVVLDPGHGGTDQGTVFDDGTVRLAEKDVTLALALETARELRTQGITVSLTRDDDRVVDLTSRTGLANKEKADVFVSLHMNSTATPMATDAEGIETYILNNTSDASSKRLARLENGILGGHEEQLGSPEKMDVALILKDLRLDANLGESKRLACGIQSSLVEAAATSQNLRFQQKNRGVRQALFHVLLGADMPSVLVEAGFLTSPRDRALVLRPEGRKTLGKALAQAIRSFKTHKNTRLASITLSKCKVHEQH